MPLEPTPSIADVADRHRRLLAFALLALGGRYVASASAHLMGPELAGPLRWVADGFALLGVGLIAPIFIWKARNLSGDVRHLYRGAEGFVAEIIARAHVGSWVVTFFTLILLEMLTGRLEALPTGFVLDVLLAVMLSSFSGVFLYLDRAPDDDVPGRGDA